MRPPAQIALVCIVFFGGGAGAYVALQIQRTNSVEAAEPAEPATSGHPEPACGPAGEPEPTPIETSAGPEKRASNRAAKAILPEPAGYYLTALRTSGLDIEAMTPTLLTPLARENIPPGCPERMAVVTGDDSHARTIKPLFDAVGRLGLSGTGAAGLADRAARQVEHAWSALVSLANGPISTPPLRILYKHYPRPDLPGKCITLHATLYNVPDSYFDMQQFQRRNTHPGDELRGVIFELRKTYQLDGNKPRLIEAMVESHEAVRVGRRYILRELLGDQAPKPLADLESAAHFMTYSGGRRFGLVWLDRASGIGTPDPWARAYSITGGSVEKEPEFRTEPLKAPLVRRLVELIGRS